MTSFEMNRLNATSWSLCLQVKVQQTKHSKKGQERERAILTCSSPDWACTRATSSHPNCWIQSPFTPMGFASFSRGFQNKQTEKDRGTRKRGDCFTLNGIAMDRKKYARINKCTDIKNKRTSRRGIKNITEQQCDFTIGSHSNY